MADCLPPLRTRFAALALAIVLFLPGFFLASKQPRDATKWIHETVFAPLMNISFAGLYPDALFAPPPVALVVFALVVLVIALSRSKRFAAAVIVPLALVIAFHLAGRPVYFPMRFESVIAGPLVLWLGESLCAWALPWRRLLAGTLLVIGAISIAIGVDSHRRRALDPYREAALMLRRHVQPGDRVVATGYLYLEAAVALESAGARLAAGAGGAPRLARCGASGCACSAPRSVHLDRGERRPGALSSAGSKAGATPVHE